jgi:hypothetical protein
VVRLNSGLKTRRPSAFRGYSPMAPPVESYVPRVSSRNGEHCTATVGLDKLPMTIGSHRRQWKEGCVRGPNAELFAELSSTFCS